MPGFKLPPQALPLVVNRGGALLTKPVRIGTRASFAKRKKVRPAASTLYSFGARSGVVTPFPPPPMFYRYPDNSMPSRENSIRAASRRTLGGNVARSFGHHA